MAAAAVPALLPHLQLTAVALLPLLHVAVAALLAAIEHLDLRHVEEAHAHTLLKAGRQVLLAAAAEDGGKGIPEEGERKAVG